MPIRLPGHDNFEVDNLLKINGYLINILEMINQPFNRMVIGCHEWLSKPSPLEPGIKKAGKGSFYLFKGKGFGFTNRLPLPIGPDYGIGPYQK